MLLTIGFWVYVTLVIGTLFVMTIRVILQTRKETRDYEHDRELVLKTKDLKCWQWGIAYYNAAQARTKEAREEIEGIAKNMYHQEEGLAGML